VGGGGVTTWLTPSEAAAALKIPVSTVTYLCRKNRMPGAHSVSGKWRIPRSTIHHDEPSVGGVEQSAAMAAKLKAAGHPSYNHPPPTSVVYFIRAGVNGPVKIGVTRNLKHRLEILGAGNHHELKCLHTIDGTVELERAMHRRFEQQHIRGEWFRYEGELRSFIRASRGTKRGGADTE